jgi:hypothetical protein
MRRHLLIAVALAGLTPHAASAQAADTVRVGSTHSALAAGLLEVVFPTAGFAYAGDWKRGFLPNAFRVGASIGFGVTADGPSDDVCEGDGTCTAFAVAVLATTVWAIVGAVQTAHDYNATIVQRESRVYIEPSALGGVSVGFRLAP